MISYDLKARNTLFPLKKSKEFGERNFIAAPKINFYKKFKKILFHITV